jgi:antimicrobial peptide system SdpB family protein
MNSFSKIEYLINKKYYFTSSFGLARSVLAFGLLITLIFNGNTILFDTNMSGFDGVRVNNYNFFSIFLLFDNLMIAKYISIIILLSVIIGIYPRITAILHFWVTYSFASCTHIIDGGDQIASILTLLFVPICILNPNKTHWKNYKSSNFYTNTICFFMYFLIMLQTFVIYFHAAVGKFVVPEWINGTAIYYWFNDPVFGASGFTKTIFNFLFKSPIFTFYANWSVLFLELFIAIAVILPYKKAKFTALILGLIFHFLIVLVHGLISFYFSMAALLIVSLYSLNNSKIQDSLKFFSSIFISRKCKKYVV